MLGSKGINLYICGQKPNNIKKMACRNNHRCATCSHPCASDVMDKEHNKWFAGLSIANKELVTGLQYPRCTEVWLSWTQDERAGAIAKSGLSRPRGNKQTALGHDF